MYILEANLIFPGKATLSILYILFLSALKMDASDDDVIFMREEHTVYYHGNDNDTEPNNDNEMTDLTTDDTAASNITHISETSLDDGQSDTFGKYCTHLKHII